LLEGGIGGDSPLPKPCNHAKSYNERGRKATKVRSHLLIQIHDSEEEREHLHANI